MSITKGEALDAYNSGVPIISDAEWDARFSRNDGTDALGKAGKIKLPSRMGSLKKYFVGDDKIPLETKSYIRTPKLDGCAGGLLYVEGKFKLATTRGDGYQGQDITRQADLLIATGVIPRYLSGDIRLDTLWITGEFTAPKSVENSRNYVAGYLNTKSLDDLKSKASEITFVVYDAVDLEVASQSITPLYMSDMHILEASGFNIITDFNDKLYPTDGIVYRTNDNLEYRLSGFTGNYKNSAFAVKERSEGVVTTLLDIIWQTGKSGKVTPVAILEPVMIGEAMVSRATLHNKNFIEEKELYPYCKVRVERSGEIIPRIIGLAIE